MEFAIQQLKSYSNKIAVPEITEIDFMNYDLAWLMDPRFFYEKTKATLRARLADGSVSCMLNASV